MGEEADEECDGNATVLRRKGGWTVEHIPWGPRDARPAKSESLNSIETWSAEPGRAWYPGERGGDGVQVKDSVSEIDG